MARKDKTKKKSKRAGGVSRKHFLNDKDGFSSEDFEKLATGLSFLLMVLSVFYQFVFKNIVSSEITTFALGLGALFVARKAFSYFKSDAYYENHPQQYPQEGYDIPTTQQPPPNPNAPYDGGELNLPDYLPPQNYRQYPNYNNHPMSPPYDNENGMG